MLPSVPTLSNFSLFKIFLKLGCTAFGGPAAHLVFFYRRFVQQLGYLDEQQYSHLLALAQILPGPTSSQMGIAIGYQLKGYRGALLAWLGFTLPSALLMTLAAMLGLQFSAYFSAEFFHVIQLIVFSVVAWAFWQMLRSFCKDQWQYVLMLLSCLFVYLVPISINQMLVILFGALAGLVYLHYFPQKSTLKPVTRISITAKKSFAYLWLILFVLPFVLVPPLQYFFPNIWLDSFTGLYRTASLVFGGGHIILPFLQQDFVESGLVSQQHFDLGYAIAQLMPGPLFSFASYLGALLPLSSSAALNAAFATVVIFLPSFFLIFGALPYWSRLMQFPRLFQALAGINAAVVGLLLCLVVQMGEKYIRSGLDIVFIIAVIALLKSKVPVWLTLISSFFCYYGILWLLDHYALFSFGL
ncbi:chromate efflux transporter [Acinetobacter sp. C_4_1]|uniref:chromate efflux transporter n=1 Tax=unclassified Acinetobacter TaxID=196816 RepID=UPI0021B7F811|nr:MULTISPECIES: chromate efflux transporter [unclassified Acinetobacter]MCT8089686.1 chromate efflux transporter [Acinetobacter sp. F_3_1]MCT8098931.1 chromate efflux transporter [Acinetobacter sp. C_3_1]MCT8100876.1 chromate efflux transporter [Acinetobacter sp. C_4_1]MCT8134627.1 chromate efflux transporter [Acinetobacter sp. T_3_1]